MDSAHSLTSRTAKDASCPAMGTPSHPSRISRHKWTTSFRGVDSILDGEIVCLDEHGCPQFEDLMFRRGELFFIAFDALWLNGDDLRTLPFLERRRRLRRVVPRSGKRSSHRLRYLDHIEADGCGLYRLSCERNLERIVGKHRGGLYDTRRPLSMLKAPSSSNEGPALFTRKANRAQCSFHAPIRTAGSAPDRVTFRQPGFGGSIVQRVGVQPQTFGSDSQGSRCMRDGLPGCHMVFVFRIVVGNDSNTRCSFHG